VNLYNIALGFGIIVAILFSALVIITGKGDAMSGGGSVRTTFKGKAGFDDIMSRWTLFLGIGFLVLMIIIAAIGNRQLAQ
jgi:preprotein translocase subunit SecG